MKIASLLAEIPDPRSRDGLYTVGEIVLLVLSGMCAGLKDLTWISAWGEANIEWLRTYLEYPNGIPSHDTIGRVLGRIKPSVVEAVFKSIVAEIVRFAPERAERHMALDGKTLRGSRKNGRALHVVHAWDVQLQQLLEMAWVDKKQNEISVLPGVLDCLDLRGSVITTDAMGAQRKLIDQVLKAGGNAIVALKENHPTVEEAIALLFQKTPRAISVLVHQETDKGHGRIEQRTTSVIGIPPSIKADLPLDGWSVKSVVQVESLRIEKGVSTTENRYYLSTLSTETHPAGRQAQLIRNHWSVENHLHRALDVQLQEDHCRVREINAAKNMAVLRRLAHSMFVQFDPSGKPMTHRMNMFSWRPKARDLLFSRFASGTTPKTIKVATGKTALSR